MRACLPVLLVLVGAVPAAANPYPVVDVGPSGPRAPLPVDGPFFLTGDVADDVVEVQPVFVRFGWAPLGGVIDAVGGPDDCARVQAALTWKADGPTIAGDLRGIVDIDALWTGPAEAGQAQSDYASLVRHQQAFVPPAWRAEAGPGRSFEVRVDARRFFRPGASFCLLVAERRSRARTDATAMRTALLQAAGGKDAPACQALLRCDGDVDCLGEHTIPCHDQMRAAALAAVPELTDAERSRVETALDRTLVQAASDLKWVERRLRRDLAAVKVDRWQMQPYHRVQGDPFGAVVAISAGVADHLRAGSATAPIGWHTVDGAVAVQAVGLRRDNDRVLVTADVGSASAVALDAAASGIPVPDASVTVRDLALFAQGAVALDGRTVPLGALHHEVGPASGRHADGPRADDDARISAIAQRIIDLDALARRAAGGAPTGGGTAAWVDAHLDPWFDAVLGDAGRTALRRAAATMRVLRDARAAWRSRVDDLTVKLVEIEVVGRPAIAQATDLDTSTWFAHYVVPTVGYAWMGADGYLQPYVALELYAFANRYDEPMWTNGVADVRRLLALELGVAPGTVRLGPEQRIDGPLDGLPPLFVGAALHPLPYGSLSVGSTLMRRRRSPLPEERGPLTAALYVGVSLQINVVQIIGQQFRTEEATW